MQAQLTQSNVAGRSAALLYGTVAYVGFLGTFLFAIAWTLGVGPFTISGAAQSGVATAILVNVGLLSLFAVQHSIMARGWFKARWTKVCPPAVERLTFVVITNLILCTIFTQWQPIEGDVWLAQGALATALQAVSLLGYGTVVVATFLIDHFELFGMKQAIRYFRGTVHSDPPFLVRSMYRFTRHPLYVGFLMAFWATPHMTYGHLLFAGVVTAYLLVAIQLEEGDLIRIHGNDYREYKQRVPMLLPRPGKTWR